MNEGPGAGAIIIGLFLIVCGLCIALLGGGCTVLLLGDLHAVFENGAIIMLLISLAILAGGVAMVWFGYKLLTGQVRNG
jgi:hypothetical protein